MLKSGINFCFGQFTLVINQKCSNCRGLLHNKRYNLIKREFQSSNPAERFQSRSHSFIPFCRLIPRVYNTDCLLKKKIEFGWLLTKGAVIIYDRGRD